ncbi:hypothetical protein pb186bvf_014935 [Paramecium bursaria]
MHTLAGYVSQKNDAQTGLTLGKSTISTKQIVTLKIFARLELDAFNIASKFFIAQAVYSSTDLFHLVIINTSNTKPIYPLGQTRFACFETIFPAVYGPIALKFSTTVVQR